MSDLSDITSPYDEVALGDIQSLLSYIRGDEKIVLAGPEAIQVRLDHRVGHFRLS